MPVRSFLRSCSALLLMTGVLSLMAPALSYAETTTATTPVVTFKDVSPNTPLAEAVQFLQSQGIISGYADGTFRPNQKVNRAEAIKIIVAPLLKKEAIALLTTTPFTDIKSNDWFLPYVEAARQNSIVDGPPAKTQFFGTRPVTETEFIKMMLLAYRIDTNAFSEIRLPLSSDVTDATAWYYPSLRYAITSSVIMINKDGLLEPTKELTRADTALFLTRFLMYRAGRRTQALLSETEIEIGVVQGNLTTTGIDQAEYASARALLAARGVNAVAPNEPIVQAALKLAEAYRAIVRGFRAGLSQQFDEAIRLSGDAWNLASKCKELNPSLTPAVEQTQSIAKQLADSARAAKAPAPAAKQ